MIGSYIKTSGRSIVRNKLFSAINIVGLAISMSVGLLLIGLISDVSSYDKFHEQHNNIYRVISRFQYLENKEPDFMATTSLKASKLIQETFSAPKGVAIFRRVFTTETRLKEISIRKIMGASEVWLLFLLGKGFFLLLAIATVIALPVTILFFERVLFLEISNTAPLSLRGMFSGIVIGSQTLKVAGANPAAGVKE